MQKSTRKYRKETPWGIIEIEEITITGGAEEDNDLQSDVVILNPYEDKYPSKNRSYQKIESFASFTVKAVCFTGAIIGIARFIMSG